MILTVGEALIDFIPTLAQNGEESFLPAPGGCPYNTAIASQRLEVPTRFLSRLSRDFFGDQLVSNLEENGVDLTYVRRSPEPTTLAFVRRDEKGNARYAFFANESADRNLGLRDLPEELPEEVAAIMFGSISLVLEPGATTIMEFVKQQSATRVISFDPNVRENLIPDRTGYISRFEKLAGLSTIVKISEDDLRWVYPGTDTRECAYTLLGLGTELVVVTRGEEGASGYTRSLEAHVDGVATEVADTIGAGDSFHAGLLAWLHHNGVLSRDRIGALTEDEVTAALRFAAHVGSITCSRNGSDPPYRSELPESAR